MTIEPGLLPRDPRPLLPRVATFFAVYPEPLALTAAGSHIVRFDEELREYTSLKRLVLHYDDDKSFVSLEPSHAVHPFVSIRFHQARHEYSRVTENVQDLLRVVREVAPSLGQPNEQPQPAAGKDLFSTYSVVEMVTPLIMPEASFWLPAPPEDRYMGPNLSRCIEGLREVVTAYRLVERQEIPAPARERLGPMILGSTRPADPDFGAWDDEGRLVVNSFATTSHPGMPDNVSANLEARMTSFVNLRRLGHPSAALMELQADAAAALNVLGDFRSAVLLIHAASEVMLDSVLMCMCWEDGMAFDSVAELFDLPLLSRLKTHYHPRLRGNWTLNAKSPVARWRSSLLLLRHQVAHAGTLPDREATEEAIEAHNGLRKHVLDRLAARIGQYPLTAAIVLGEIGLHRRGALTKRGRTAVREASLDRVVEYVAWSRSVLVSRMAN